MPNTESNASEQQSQGTANEPKKPDIIKLNTDGSFGPTSAEQVVRIGQSVLLSKALPSHISSVHVFCVAWNILSGMGLRPMAYMSKTYWVPRSNTLGIMVEVLLAAVLKHPSYRGRSEWLIDKNYKKLDETNWMDAEPAGAICIIRRQMGEQVIQTEARFSIKDAKGLGIGGGNYTKQPGNMLAIRARGRAIKEAFADIIGGVPVQGQDDDYGDSQPAIRDDAPGVPAGRNIQSLMSDPVKDLP